MTVWVGSGVLSLWTAMAGIETHLSLQLQSWVVFPVTHDRAGGNRRVSIHEVMPQVRHRMEGTGASSEQEVNILPE